MGEINSCNQGEFRWYCRPLHDTHPPSGEQAMKEQVRIRDHYMCRDCSITQEEHVERFGESLHVHHLHARSDVDDSSRSHLMTNLVTLCNQCHQYWDSLPPYLQVDAFLGPYLDYPLFWPATSTKYQQLRDSLSTYGQPRVKRLERWSIALGGSKWRDRP